MATNDTDRRAALQSYIMACIAQNILSLDDLRQPLVALARIGGTMLADLKIVGMEILQGAGAVGSMKAAEGFLALAAQLEQKRKR